MISETDSVTELKKQQQQELVAEDHMSPIHGSEVGESPSSHMAGFSPGIDPDIARMETLMEQWLGDLKRNVLVSGTCYMTLPFKFVVLFLTCSFTAEFCYFYCRQSLVIQESDRWKDPGSISKKKERSEFEDFVQKIPGTFISID